MTHTDYTKKILNIEDENIYFYEEFKFSFKLSIMVLNQKMMVLNYNVK